LPAAEALTVGPLRPDPLRGMRLWRAGVTVFVAPAPPPPMSPPPLYCCCSRDGWRCGRRGRRRHVADQTDRRVGRVVDGRAGTGWWYSPLPIGCGHRLRFYFASLNEILRRVCTFASLLLLQDRRAVAQDGGESAAPDSGPSAARHGARLPRGVPVSPLTTLNVASETPRMGTAKGR